VYHAYDVSPYLAGKGLKVFNIAHGKKLRVRFDDKIRIMTKPDTSLRWRLIKTIVTILESSAFVLRKQFIFLHVRLKRMDKKLTLSLNQGIIEKAKSYASSKNISLSKLIEAYLNALTSSENEHEEITPLVKSLSGVIVLEEGIDEKEDYANYLLNKHR